MQGKVGVRESLDWKPGCPVGCMLVKVHTVFEPGWKIFLQHYLLVRRQEIRERERLCAHATMCECVRDCSGFGSGPSVGMFALDMTFGVT